MADNVETCPTVGVLDISVIFRVYLILFFIAVADPILFFGAEFRALGMLLLLLFYPFFREYLDILI